MKKNLKTLKKKFENNFTLGTFKLFLKLLNSNIDAASEPLNRLNSNINQL
jgi:hypothetical protein